MPYLAVELDVPTKTWTVVAYTTVKREREGTLILDTSAEDDVVINEISCHLFAYGVEDQELEEAREALFQEILKNVDKIKLEY